MLERFRAEVGYCSTKLGADAAIVSDDERMLLVRRADDGCWSMCAGWVEPGEAPEATVVREVKEEIGLDVVVDELVGLFNRPANAEHGPHGFAGAVYLCSIVGGDVQPLEHEVFEVAWLHLDDVDGWHERHGDWARAALARWRQRNGESAP